METGAQPCATTAVATTALGRSLALQKNQTKQADAGVMMVVGVLTVELHLYEATSLKEKRHVVRSTLDTLRNKFNLSAAEVDHLDEWQQATLGFSCVGNDKQHVNSVLNKALDFLYADPRIEVVEVNLELW